MASDYTYMPGPDGCEEIELYGHGGFHPVDIGDCFNNEQYKIIHKLGYGGSAVAWLARDNINCKYVALKILSAEHSTYSKEILVQEYIQDATGATLSTIIVKALKQFTIHGPNGDHVCIVLELAGPSLQILFERHIKFRPNTARNLAKQITQAIGDLHSAGVVVGDLSAANLLLRLSNIDDKPQAELYEIIGKPKLFPVDILGYDDSKSDTALEPVVSATPRAQCQELTFPIDMLEPYVLITDINDAVLDTKGQLDANSAEEEESSGVCEFYAAPEWKFDIQARHTRASDIWALACIFYELRTSDRLFHPASMVFNDQTSSQQISQLIGNPPLELKEAILNVEGEARFNSDSENNPSATLAGRLAAVGDWHKWHYLSREEKRQLVVRNIEDGLTNPDHPDYGFDIEELISIYPPHAPLSPQELLDITDLLSKMLRWLPEDRTTMEEVLAHPWLNTEYTDLDPDCPKICTYSKGSLQKMPTEQERKALRERKARANREIKNVVPDGEGDEVLTNIENMQGESVA